MVRTRDYEVTSIFVMKSLLIYRFISSSLILSMPSGCHPEERCSKELRGMPLKRSPFICWMVLLSSTNHIISSTAIVTSCAFLQILFQMVKGQQANHYLTSMAGVFEPWRQEFRTDEEHLPGNGRLRRPGMFFLQVMRFLPSLREGKKRITCKKTEQRLCLCLHASIAPTVLKPPFFF